MFSGFLHQGVPHQCWEKTKQNKKPTIQFLFPSLSCNCKNSNPLAFHKCSGLPMPQPHPWLAHHISTFRYKLSNLPGHLNHLEGFFKNTDALVPTPHARNSDVVGMGCRLGTGILKPPRWFWCAAKFENHCRKSAVLKAWSSDQQHRDPLGAC